MGIWVMQGPCTRSQGTGHSCTGAGRTITLSSKSASGDPRQRAKQFIVPACRYGALLSHICSEGGGEAGSSPDAHSRIFCFCCLLETIIFLMLNHFRLSRSVPIVPIFCSLLQTPRIPTTLSSPWSVCLSEAWFYGTN